MSHRSLLLIGLFSTPLPVFSHGLGVKTTSISSDPPLSQVTPSPIIKRQDAGNGSCGFINGDFNRPVTCSPGTCGFLYVPDASVVSMACCTSGACSYYTTCRDSLEMASPAPGGIPEFAITCAGGSPACVTYTWPGISAVGYGCDTSRGIFSVSISSSSTESSTASAEPTQTGGSSDDDAGDSPGLGQENGLSLSQRIGASVGSGILGALMLAIFVIFGCLLRIPEIEDGLEPVIVQESGREQGGPGSFFGVNTQYMQYTQYPPMAEAGAGNDYTMGGAKMVVDSSTSGAYEPLNNGRWKEGFSDVPIR